MTSVVRSARRKDKAQWGEHRTKRMVLEEFELLQGQFDKGFGP
ncbi:hypothetical protein ACFLT5_04235 [Chloroflexota bacterium]